MRTYPARSRSMHRQPESHGFRSAEKSIVAESGVLDLISAQYARQFLYAGLGSDECQWGSRLPSPEVRTAHILKQAA